MTAAEWELHAGHSYDKAAWSTSGCWPSKRGWHARRRKVRAIALDRLGFAN
jgi:hypothetical protein